MPMMLDIGSLNRPSMEQQVYLQLVWYQTVTTPTGLVLLQLLMPIRPKPTQPPGLLAHEASSAAGPQHTPPAWTRLQGTVAFH